MDTATFSQLFSSFQERDGIAGAFKEVLSDREAGLSYVGGRLEAFAGEPALLGSAEGRNELSCLFLLAGMLDDSRLFAPVMKIAMLPEFSQHITQESWLYCALSRLFGVLVPAEDGTDFLVNTILSADTAMLVREQLVMALVFRWLGNRDNDKVFGANIRRLLTTLKPEQVSFELGMGLVVNAIAVGGDSIRQEVDAFYKANADKLRAQLPEKNLRTFFDLGRQRIKSLLRGNYLGEFGKVDEEVEAMLTFAERQNAEGGEDPAAAAALPPITRDEPKIGRNDPCPCGSGKKYKKCCGR